MLTYTKHVEYSTCPRAYSRGQGVLGTVPVTLRCSAGLMSVHLPGLEAAEKRKTLVCLEPWWQASCSRCFHSECSKPPDLRRPLDFSTTDAMMEVLFRPWNPAHR